jgi:hypothetical protein
MRAGKGSFERHEFLQLKARLQEGEIGYFSINFEVK